MFRSKNITLKDWSPEDRPREKLLEKGVRSLTNAELIAILLGSGSVGMPVVDLSKKIIADYNHSLTELAKATIPDLTKKYRGIGVAKAVTIISALELARRQQSEQAIDKPVISSSREAYDRMKPVIASLKHEEFWVIFLNRANKVLAVKNFGSGTQTATLADTRMIVKSALDHNATAIVLAHNHPSGVAKPSQEDKILTDQIYKAAHFFSIVLFDHIIVCETEFFSFRDEGLI